MRIIATVNRKEEGSRTYNRYADRSTYRPILGEELGDQTGRRLIYSVDTDRPEALDRFLEEDNVLTAERDTKSFFIPEPYPARLQEVQENATAIPELEVLNYIGQGGAFQRMEFDGTGLVYPDGVEVAVLDTGLDATWALRLGSRLKQTAQFTDEAHPPILPEGVGHFHGTHCAGLVCAGNNLNLNVAQVLGDDGSGNNSWITEGIYWAVRQGCRVASLSLGSYSDSPTIQDAVTYARSRGCLIVAAMGNEGAYRQMYPAAYTGVAGILASHYTTELRASFSNYGEWGYLTTEGVSVLSWVLSGVFGRASGTSMATPLAARALGLLIAEFGSPSAVLKTMGATADPTPEPVLEEGHGRLHTRLAAEELERSFR